MISETDLKALITEALPDAHVDVLDKTGMQDHYIAFVKAAAFEGKSALERHRMVLEAVKPAHDDQRLHAIEIKTAVPETATS